jgi:hypothetical protein
MAEENWTRCNGTLPGEVSELRRGLGMEIADKIC